VLLSLLLSATAKCSRRSTGAPPTTECPRNAIHGLDPRHHQLAKLIDIARLGADDHVVGPSDILGQQHALDGDDILGTRAALPTSVWTRMYAVTTINDPLASLATAGTNPS
jgi:hypothetical protein